MQHSSHSKLLPLTTAIYIKIENDVFTWKNSTSLRHSLSAPIYTPLGGLAIINTRKEKIEHEINSSRRTFAVETTNCMSAHLCR